MISQFFRALNITTRFPNYTVQFDGVGPGPEGSESVGYCTQVAVFLKHSDEDEQLSEVPRSCREIITMAILNADRPNESQGICTHYSYIKQIQAFNATESNQSDIFYKELQHVDYPFHVDDRSPEERALDEIRYKLFSTYTTSKFYNENRERIEYPLEELAKHEDGYFTTIPELRYKEQIDNNSVLTVKKVSEQLKTLRIGILYVM